MSCVCLSPQTPPSVWKLEGWNFHILMRKKTLIRFLKFCLGTETGGFFWTRLGRVREGASSLGIFMINLHTKFQPSCFRTEGEVEVTEGVWNGRTNGRLGYKDLPYFKISPHWPSRIFYSCLWRVCIFQHTRNASQFMLLMPKSTYTNSKISHELSKCNFFWLFSESFLMKILLSWLRFFKIFLCSNVAVWSLRLPEGARARPSIQSYKPVTLQSTARCHGNVPRRPPAHLFPV